VSLTINQLANNPKTFVEKVIKETSSHAASRLLAVISFENITPTLIGGYNAATGSLELELAESVRLTEIKGLWRWWARALLLGCEGKQSLKNVKEVCEKVAELLGSTRSPSKVELRLHMERDTCELFKNRKDHLYKVAKAYSRREVDKEIQKSSSKHGDRNSSYTATSRGQIADEFNKLVESIPRTKIIGMGVPYNKKKIKDEAQREVIDEKKKEIMAEENAKALVNKLFVFCPGELRGKIEVYEYLHGKGGLGKSERNFLVGSLLVALTFGGIGAITSRGFGAISLSCEYVGKDVEEKFKEITRRIFEEKNEENVKEVEKSLVELVKCTLKYGKELFSVPAQCEMSTIPSTIPEYPTADPENNVLRIEVVSVNAEKPFELLEKIGKATLKNEWKKNAKSSPKKSGSFHTWILGLPRMQHGKGYYYKGKGDESRRRSAINIRPIVPLKKRNVWLVAVYGFLSKDWNVENLVHKGKTEKKVKDYEIIKCDVVSEKIGQDKILDDEKFIEGVFNAAFCFVKKLLR